MCKDKEKIKKERQEAKKLRTKIVGVGNTMDSYGDKFQSGKTDPYEETRMGSRKRDKDPTDSEPGDPKHGGSYDPYVSTKPLTEAFWEIPATGRNSPVNRLNKRKTAILVIIICVFGKR